MQCLFQLCPTYTGKRRNPSAFHSILDCIISFLLSMFFLLNWGNSSSYHRSCSHLVRLFHFSTKNTRTRQMLWYSHAQHTYMLDVTLLGFDCFLFSLWKCMTTSYHRRRKKKEYVRGKTQLGYNVTHIYIYIQHVHSTNRHDITLMVDCA